MIVDVTRHYTHLPKSGLRIAPAKSMSVNAFHKKPGGSQVGSSLGLVNKVFSPAELATVAMLASALSRSDFGSLGARWAFSFQPALACF